MYKLPFISVCRCSKCVRSDQAAVRLPGGPLTIVWLLAAVSAALMSPKYPVELTCVQQIQSVVKLIALLHLGITAKNNECIANKQTGMAHSRSRAFRCGGDGEATEIARSGLDHPEVTLHRAAIDQAAHQIHRAILACSRVDRCAITWKRIGMRDSEI